MKFTRQPATLAQTSDHYYELRADGIVTIGEASKSRLEAWALTHGFAPTFVDERKHTTANTLDEQDNVCQICGDHRPCECDYHNRAVMEPLDADDTE